MEHTVESDHSPRRSYRKKKVMVAAHSKVGDGSWEGPATIEKSDEEITPSPNMFTRLQERRLLTLRGDSSAISGLVSQAKYRTTSKKHRTT